MSAQVNKMMVSSVLTYLENVKGIEKDWISQELLAALEGEKSYIPRTLQNQLFDKVLKEFGPKALEESSSVLVMNAKSPLLFALLNTGSPLQAVEKLIRFKKYLHSFAQMKIIQQDSNSITVTHYFSEGVPHPGEHRYTVGALKTILETIGCQGLTWKLEMETGQDGLLHETAGLREDPERIGQEIWTFGWASFEANYRVMEGLDEVLTANLPILSGLKSYIQQVRSLLWSNLSEGWTLDQVAEKLGYSTRALQRALKREGTRYSLVLSDIREERAKELLHQTTGSITEIGFFLGFADTAHFSREFKSKTGMAPTEFRKKLEL